jgi:prophage regulatory protein
MNAAEGSMQELKFDRLPAVLAMVGVGKTTLYTSLIPQHGFPKPVNLGGRAVVWERGEVQAWLRTRLAARQEGES